MKKIIISASLLSALFGQMALANPTRAQFTCDFGKGLAIGDNSSQSKTSATDTLGVFTFTFDLKTKKFTNKEGQGNDIYIPQDAFEFSALQPMKKNGLTQLITPKEAYTSGNDKLAPYGIIRFTGGNADDSLYFLDLYLNVQDWGVRAVFTTQWDTAVQTFSAFDCKVQELK